MITILFFVVAVFVWGQIALSVPCLALVICEKNDMEWPEGKLGAWTGGIAFLAWVGWAIYSIGLAHSATTWLWNN